jgi:hypothetical protein
MVRLKADTPDGLLCVLGVLRVDRRVFSFLD